MKNAVLQMLETWLSKERLLLNSTPRFLTDDEEFYRASHQVLDSVLVITCGGFRSDN